jgi:hypothetical protein
MLLGTEVEVEVGMRLSPTAEQHSKFLIRGEGISEMFNLMNCMREFERY